jgi:hypothetical protein
MFFEKLRHYTHIHSGNNHGIVEYNRTRSLCSWNKWEVLRNMVAEHNWSRPSIDQSHCDTENPAIFVNFWI